jgi:hypothetical protein
MYNPKFQIYKDNVGGYRFRLKARNGEIIIHSSQGYVYKYQCQDAVTSVKNNSPYDSRYSRNIATNGQYYFSLKTLDGKILGMSEMYNSIQGRDNGIESVKTNAPDAPVEDLTIA